MSTVLKNEENVVVLTEKEEIDELASMLAELGIDEDFDADAVLDALYAEHEERMRAANSYDEDAISYGEII
jgi:precorrin-6B methylase 1